MRKKFNENSLNTSKWNYNIGNGCPSLCGWGNSELQQFTSSNENLYFKEGNLIIEAKNEAKHWATQYMNKCAPINAGAPSRMFGEILILNSTYFIFPWAFWDLLPGPLPKALCVLSRMPAVFLTKEYNDPDF